jgi:hypothetical protein
VLCSDQETPCSNLVPAEITLKICQKIKVSLQPPPAAFLAAPACSSYFPGLPVYRRLDPAPQQSSRRSTQASLFGLFQHNSRGTQYCLLTTHCVLVCVQIISKLVSTEHTDTEHTEICAPPPPLTGW